MKLNLTYVESKGGNFAEDVKQLGTFGEGLDDSDKVSFSPKNLQKLVSDTTGGYNRVVIVIYEKDRAEGDPPASINCSEMLSRVVRKALENESEEVVMRALFSLRVIDTKEKGHYIIPSSDPTELLSVKKLKKTEEVTYEELVAF